LLADLTGEAFNLQEIGDKLLDVADVAGCADGDAGFADNRNDAQRQVEAKKEQQHAEFTEAVQKYGQTFRLMNAPTTFPTK